MAISFSWLKQDERFLSAMKKMSFNSELEDEELEFLLACAVLFIREYSEDRRKTPYFELAYYIVLKCGVNNNVYEPLLDVSSNFGLYPISKYILENDLFVGEAPSNFSLDYQLDKFRYRDVIETYEQKNNREALVCSYEIDNCYVAPTSFGKSSLMVDIIKEKNLPKVSIIVPTKSLLVQTYKIIKSNFPDKTIIFHDEMYGGEEEFLSIFTQERALRLLKEESVSFDLLIIDEAHNLFEMDARSILLTRLIRRNRQRNPKCINYYLSPLISDANNLKVDNGQEIFERKIINNIKEPDIFELDKSGKIKKYNRFIDEFFVFGESEGFLDYIIDNSKNKNFIYLRAPRRIEQFSTKLASRLNNLDSESLNDLSEVVSNNIHKDFYCVDYIKKGLVYLHGKLPDLIKEYLEYKFSKNDDVRYVIANSVILEGVNLPVDNMYIMNTDSLNVKSMTNLIGRVNRLNEVFDNERRSLDKLFPSIHFVNSEFNRKNGNMESKIRKLKKSSFKDEVNNPILLAFDDEKMAEELAAAESGGDVEKADSLRRKVDRYARIREKEDFLIYGGLDDDRIKKILLESSVLSVYINSEALAQKIEFRINEIFSDQEWANAHVIDKVYLCFIKGLEEYIARPDFLRLQHERARAYYKKFTSNLHRLSLKEHISETIAYFQSIRDKPQGKEFYIGSSYGEFPKSSPAGSSGNNVYLDLSTKSSKDLANISLIKIKIESDFVSYTLNEYVNVLNDVGLLSEDEYNLYIYGTVKKANANLVKIGFSGSLVNMLEKEGQAKNISVNEHGLVEVNEDFVSFIRSQDDLVQFEVSKFLDM